MTRKFLIKFFSKEFVKDKHKARYSFMLLAIGVFLVLSDKPIIKVFGYTMIGVGLGLLSTSM